MTRIIHDTQHQGVHFVGVDIDHPDTASIIEKFGLPLLEAVYLKECWAAMRKQRNDLITLTDWTQLADSPLTAAQKKQFADYRKKLRNLPEDFDDPHAVVWPEKPAL